MGTKGHVTWACTHIGRDRQSWAGPKQTSPPPVSSSFFLGSSQKKRNETKRTKRKKKREKHSKDDRPFLPGRNPALNLCVGAGLTHPSPLHAHLFLSCLNLHLPSDHPLPSTSTTRIFHIRSLLGRFPAVDHIQLRRWQQFCPWSFFVCHLRVFLYPCHVRESRLSLLRTLKRSYVVIFLEWLLSQKNKI